MFILRPAAFQILSIDMFVFLDSPYRLGELSNILKEMNESKAVCTGTMIDRES